MDLEKARELLESCSTSKLDSGISSVQSLKSNKDLINGIIQNLPEQYAHQMSDGVYNQLFELYRSGGRDARLFVLQFVPVFVWISLSATSRREKQAYGKLEAILLAIYNAEVLDNKGQSKGKTFRLPSLSRPSIYHESSQSLGSASALTVSALSRHEQIENPVVLPGPGRELDRIVAAHRLSVLTVVLNQYNSNIAFMTEASQKSYCMMALRVAKSGFTRLCNVNSECDKSLDQFSPGELKKLGSHPRICLNAEFIQELLQGLTFLVYNGQRESASQAIEDLKWRASHSLFASAHLLTSAIENTYRQATQEGPLGLQIVLTAKETGESNKTQTQSLKTLEVPDGRLRVVALQTSGITVKCGEYEDTAPEGKNEVDSGNIQLEWVEGETKSKSTHKKASSGTWKIHLVSQKADVDLPSVEFSRRKSEEAPTPHLIEANKSKGVSSEVNLVSYNKLPDDGSASKLNKESDESAL